MCHHSRIRPRNIDVLLFEGVASWLTVCFDCLFLYHSWLLWINVAVLSLSVIIARCCHYVMVCSCVWLSTVFDPVLWCFWCSVCFAVVLMNVFVREARQTLPQLVGFLSSGLMKGDSSPEHDSTMATAIHSAHALMKADPETGKSLLNNSLINSLNNMSLNLWVRTSYCSFSLVHILDIWIRLLELRRQKKIEDIFPLVLYFCCTFYYAHCSKEN